MKKILFIIIGVLGTFLAMAQQGFSDDFSDGNFTQNPEWISTAVAAFSVNPKKALQLTAPSAGKAGIKTKYLSDTAMVWEFYIQMDFPPSGSNRLIIFPEKSTDSRDTAANLALLIGEDGSDDKIRGFFTRSGSISGTPAFSAGSTCVVNSQVKARIRIKRSADGVWTLEADYSGGFAYRKEAEFRTGRRFDSGNLEKEMVISTEFTETRKDKFFFDDFYVRKPESDKKAPSALTATAVNARQIDLLFDEVLDSSAGSSGLYKIYPGPIDIDSVVYAYNRIGLHINKTLLPDSIYRIFIGIVSDLYGNTASPIVLECNTSGLTQHPEKFDIIINEIMASPLPQVALPKAEYIEIYNRSTKKINLRGWKIRDSGKTEYTLPEYIIGPDKFLIISKRVSGIDFGKYGDTLYLNALFALDSDADDLYLYDASGNLSDEIHYDSHTYKDDSKSIGGYSLERINPAFPCLGAANFCASTSPDGGTPGRRNAVYSVLQGKDSIRLLSVFPMDSNILRLQFDRPPDNGTLNALQYSESLRAESYSPGKNSIEILVTLLQNLEKGRLYSLSIDSQLCDCAGNAAVADTFKFALPEKANNGDLLINEILFNPRPGGYDFVELYNKSAKAINLMGLYLANEKSGGSKTQIQSDYLLLPGKYVLITENPGNIQLSYKTGNKALLKNELPSLPDDEGDIIIYFADSPGKREIDKLYYSSSWHYQLLISDEGVSLERLYFDYPTQDENNWASAASAAGFATPGLRNSQHLDKQEDNGEEFYIENGRISPDNDGFEDFLVIHYRLRPETNANINVYGLSGRLLKTLVRNETLQTEGEVSWDGICDDGSRIAAGMYPLVFEYFQPDGSVGKKYRLLTVVYKI